MKAKTRLFGEIEIEDGKLITLEEGMIGFPDLQKFALIYNEEDKDALIRWLQSMDDPDIAFPVVEPNEIMPDYKPVVNDELLEPLGGITEDNLYILNTITIPKHVEDMAVNLKAPIVINTDTNRGRQLIVENDFPVRYRFYKDLAKRKEKAGE